MGNFFDLSVHKYMRGLEKQLVDDHLLSKRDATTTLGSVR